VLLALSLCFFCVLVTGAEDFESAFDTDEFETDTIPPAQASTSESAPAKAPISQVPITAQNTEIEEEEEEDFFDEEEFIGINPGNIPKPIKKKSAPAAAPEKIVESVPETPKQIKSWSERDWTIELIFVNVFVGYMINFFIGKSKNYRIARTWFERYLPLFKENFYLIGRKKSVLINEGYNSYSLTATGRNNCGGIHCELLLKKRQDLFSILWYMIFPSNDLLNIVVPLPEESVPFILAIIPTAGRSEFTQNHAKELTFLKKKSIPELESKYECYTENPELVSTVLGDEIIALLAHYPNLFESLYISDICPTYVLEKKILQLQFRIPGNMADFDALMKFTIFFIDKLANVKLSKTATSAIKKNRQRIEEERDKEAHAQRQERAKAAKEKKHQELLEKLSPEEQEKLKEKEQKKKLRKQQLKQTKRVLMP